MRLVKIMSIITIIASLFGCGRNEPQILDGPGMVYVDSEYRTEYANCLPFDDIEGRPYMAVAYLGSGEEGKANKEVYIGKIFENMDEEIKTYEFEGNDWFLVIPRYRSLTDLKKDGKIIQRAAEQGEAFFVQCNNDVTVNIFETVDINYILSYDENGKLANTDENIWDITDIDDILN